MQRQNRVLSRLVLSPTGRPLVDPTLSPLQVAEGLLAGLVGHASLFFQGGILHRDISPNNIIVVDQDLPQLTFVSPPAAHGDPFEWIWPRDVPLRGCLIDLDYAIEASAHPSGALDRTGTYPFIAIQILSGLERHRYRHDLESFLYVLLWVCCYPTNAPISTTPTTTTTNPDPPIWPLKDPLALWCDADPASVVNHKIANVMYGSQNFHALFDRFRPGFGHFKRVAREMRLTLWRRSARSKKCDLAVERKLNASTPAGGGGDGSASAQQGSKHRAEDDEDDEENEDGEDKEGDEDDEDEDNDGDEEEEEVLPDEVRLGVSNKDAFLEVKKLLQRPMASLKKQAKREQKQRRNV